MTRKWTIDLNTVDCRNAFPLGVFFTDPVDTLPYLGLLRGVTDDLYALNIVGIELIYSLGVSAGFRKLR
jgi:hypothetical protein